jgi:NAD(P)-dependent dehydrogenase (short-subunit alcohol dehydrogenase family)
VTQALLPLLRRSLGRIVNVGSIGGRYGLPINGPYTASKAALHVLTQAQRMELRPFDVRVSYIEPGSHRSSIWERGRKAAQDISGRLPAPCAAYYGPVMSAMQALADTVERDGADPLAVARAIAHALESPRPRLRYRVGRDTRLHILLGLLPQALREQLIAARVEAAAHS